ncbi:hypothetical protein I3A86_23680, partial [Salmonella enterica]|nr:hypothetical protein [Salmonella enterica]
MADKIRNGALALIAVGTIALAAGACFVGEAHAEDAKDVAKRPVAAQARVRAAARPRAVRTAAADRPLTIRRRAVVGPYD